jgi:hypothetical protein
LVDGYGVHEGRAGGPSSWLDSAIFPNPALDAQSFA